MIRGGEEGGKKLHELKSLARKYDGKVMKGKSAGNETTADNFET